RPVRSLELCEQRVGQGARSWAPCRRSPRRGGDRGGWIRWSRLQNGAPPGRRRMLGRGRVVAGGLGMLLDDTGVLSGPELGIEVPGSDSPGRIRGFDKLD